MPDSRHHNLKIGIIGCGGIASVHIKYVINAVTKINIALCDRDEVRLHDFANRHGIERAFTSIEDLFTRFRPDVVHILTPPASHKALIVECLKKGAHVLVEKPMCLTDHEGSEIMHAAKNAQRLVCVDHMRSFDPQVQNVAKDLRSGKLGELVSIKACYSHDMLFNKKFVGNKWSADLPGGMLFDVSPHIIYLIQEFIPDAEVVNTVSRQNTEDVVTDMTTLFKGSKATAVMELSLRIFPLQNFIKFYCTNGEVKIDLRNFVTIIRRKSGLPNVIDRITGSIGVGRQYVTSAMLSVVKFFLGRLDPYQGLNRIIREFYTAIQKGGISPVPAESGRKLAAISDTVFSVIQRDRRPDSDLDLTEDHIPKCDVLVTGGTGFIGSRLVDRLVSEGHTVRVLTHRNMRDITPNKDIQYLHGDVYSYRDAKKAVSGVSRVYHLAAAMSGDWNNHLDTTVTGTQNILNACVENEVPHLVYVSTLNVYNASRYPNSQLIDESFEFEDKPEMRGSYSHAKLKAEDIVREYADKHPALAVTILRPGLVYGANGNSFPKDVGIRIGGKFALIMGFGMRKLPLVHVDNLVDALIGAGNAEQRGIYNVVDSDYPTQNQYIKAYNNCSKAHIIPVYVPFWVFMFAFWVLEKSLRLLLRKKAALVYKLRCISKSPIHSTEKIADELSWQQRFDFTKGMKLMLE